MIAAKAEGSAATAPQNAMAMATADAENAPAADGSAADQGADNASPSHASDVPVLAVAEVNAAPADLGPVAKLDQTFTAPYVDRGILFFREKKGDNPFPDLPPLKKAEKPGHPKSVLAANGKGREALPKVVPLPVPRTVLRYVTPRPQPWYAQRRQEPWYASATFQ